MSDPSCDGMGEMRIRRLDPATADRLLAAAMTPDDAPPGYGQVSALLGQARPGPATDPHRRTTTIAAMAAAVPVHLATSSTTTGDKGMLSKFLTIKAAAAASAVLLGAGTAAAATGSLPAPAQHAASEVLAKVGISVPSGDSHDSTGTSGSGTSSDAGHSTTSGSTTKGNNSNNGSNGPSANAEFGLCNAEAHNDGHPAPNATVFPPSTTCTTVTHPGNAGTESSEPDQSTETTEANEGAEHGATGSPATGTPPVPVPDQGSSGDGSTGSTGSTGSSGDTHGAPTSGSAASHDGTGVSSSTGQH